jgi:hypothetical protein
MRGLPGMNGAWEERYDVYQRCAFADFHRHPGADTLRLPSHQIIA